MSKNVAELLDELEELTTEQLVEVLEGVSQQLRRKTIASNRSYQSANPNAPLPGTYRRTPEQIEASLAAIFTPEEIAIIGQHDLSQRPLPGKSSSQMIIEDREDRF